MAFILSIETSTKVCSVALHKNGVLLSHTELFIEQSHSVMLNTLISNNLHYVNHTLDDLDAIAVSKGPGSYTGLRIGVATAKGLCYALDKPLIGISSLKAMAYQVSTFLPDPQTLVCPMIDARRMEVYCAIFNRDLEEVSPIEAKIIDGSSFEDILDTHKVVFGGDGSKKCQELLSAHSNSFFLENIYPSAQAIGFLADKAFDNKEFEDVAYFEPFYLKDFIGLQLKSLPSS